jgi:hypothetical protein
MSRYTSPAILASWMKGANNFVLDSGKPNFHLRVVKCHFKGAMKTIQAPYM